MDSRMAGSCARVSGLPMAAGYVGGPEACPATVSVGQVHVATGMLSESANGLYKTISILADRLVPVLSADNAMKSGAVAKDGSACELASKLESVSDTVNACDQLVRELLSRLEV